MMKRSLFYINQPLEVFDPKQKIYYQSVIEELADDYVVIGVPLYRREQLCLSRDTVWTFRFTLEDSLCYFRSKCLGRKREERLLHFFIARPQELKRVQRRRYYRVSCSFDARYWVLANRAVLPEKPSEQMGKPETAVVVDISGGGLQLVTSKPLPGDAVLLMALDLKSGKIKKTVYLKGRLVRPGSDQRERKMSFRYSLEYVELPEALRENIINFVFLLSRKRLV